MNLGDKLKAANEARERAKINEEEGKRELEQVMYKADHRMISLFFERAMDEFAIAIENGKPIKPVEIPEGSPYNTYSWNGQNMIGKLTVSHPHHTAFEPFFKWADENGLVGKLLYQHDGVGIRSWYVVTVEPK